LYAARLGLTTTDVGLSLRLAYDRVIHTAPACWSTISELSVSYHVTSNFAECRYYTTFKESFPYCLRLESHGQVCW